MTEPTGQPAPPAPTNPEGGEAQTPDLGKFTGKSAADIASAYGELEKSLGKQGEELGGLRRENEQMRGYLQEVLRAQQQNQAQARPQPEQSTAPTSWDWEKPENSAKAIAAAAAREEAQKMYRALRTEQAMTAATFAEQQAKQAYPHLFEGTNGNEVRSFMQQAVQTGQVAPNAIENPTMWANIAYVMQGMKNGFRAPGGVNPVSPDVDEPPTRAKKSVDNDGAEPIELDRDMEDAIKAFGRDKDKFVKELRAERGKGGARR